MVKSGKSLRKVGPLATSPSHLMHRALQLALDIYSEEMGADGLTQRQFAVLEAASLKAGLTQTELVRMTGIDRSTLADLVTRMTAKGLLERERSTLDARAKAVRLSTEGAARLEAARARPSWPSWLNWPPPPTPPPTPPRPRPRPPRRR